MIKTLVLFAVTLTSFLTLAHEHPVPAKNPLKAHLSYKGKTLHLHTELNAEPKVGVESILKIEARRGSDHSLVSINDTVEVELWMPDMGHGSAPTQVTRAIDTNGNAIEGTYIVRNLFFIMGGTWEVRVSLIDSSGNKETQSFIVTLDGEHHH